MLLLFTASKVSFNPISKFNLMKNFKFQRQLSNLVLYSIKVYLDIILKFIK